MREDEDVEQYDPELLRIIDALSASRYGWYLKQSDLRTMAQAQAWARSGKGLGIRGLGKRGETLFRQALGVEPTGVSARSAGVVLAEGEPTRKIVEMVSIERWLCLVGTHRHKTRDAAKACIARKPKRTGSPKSWRESWGTHCDIALAYINGATHAAIAEDRCLSVSRSQQIVASVMRRVVVLSRPDETLAKLPRGAKARDRADEWIAAIKAARELPDDLP